MSWTRRRVLATLAAPWIARAAGAKPQVAVMAKPGDLPLEKAASPRLYVNDATAKALGLRIPPALRKAVHPA